MRHRCTKTAALTSQISSEVNAKSPLQNQHCYEWSYLLSSYERTVFTVDPIFKRLLCSMDIRSFLHTFILQRDFTFMRSSIRLLICIGEMCIRLISSLFPWPHSRSIGCCPKSLCGTCPVFHDYIYHPECTPFRFAYPVPSQQVSIVRKQYHLWSNNNVKYNYTIKKWKRGLN